MSRQKNAEENGSSAPISQSEERAELIKKIPRLSTGVSKERIFEIYMAAPGDEIKSGKLANLESSAFLVANAFGFFLDRSADLPPLPGTEGFGWPAVQPIQIEQEVRFPWHGGCHPHLDVWIETANALIGVESKRYEPFNTKFENNRAAFSDAYWRPVWGESMRGYEAVRDLLRDNPGHYTHLNAPQLIKHAFALRTAAHREQYNGKSPVLYYLFGEPPSRFGGTQVTQDAIALHRREIADFATRVSGDEVQFLSCSYLEWLATWKTASKTKIAAHALNLYTTFFGLFQGLDRLWPKRFNEFPFEDEIFVLSWLENVFGQLTCNWERGRARRGKLPSRENWRWPAPAKNLTAYKKPEVSLERRFIQAAERRREANGEKHKWCNQIPVASGTENSANRHCNIDLVEQRGPCAFNFVELKIASDDPLSAAQQIVEYGFLWLISRKHQTECQYSGALIEADDVCLSVLSPPAYYHRKTAECLVFQQTLNGALSEIGRREGVTLGFEFQTLAGDYSPEIALSDEELLALIENRKVLAPADGLSAC